MITECIFVLGSYRHSFWPCIWILFDTDQLFLFILMVIWMT